MTTPGPSAVFDVAPLFGAGTAVFDSHRGLGLPIAEVPGTGTDGAGLLYRLIQGGDSVQSEMRLKVTRFPAAGVLTFDGLGGYTYVGGTDSFDYSVWVDGALIGSATETLVSAAGGTVTISCTVGAAAALGLTATVSGAGPSNTIAAGVGNAVAAGLTATVSNTPTATVTIACLVGAAIATGATCTIINGTASIVVAPHRVLIGDGLNQPDIDGTYVMRSGRPTIDTDPDANLFYAVDLTSEMAESNASLVSVTGVTSGAAVAIAPFVQGGRVVAKIKVPGVVDDGLVHSYTFRFVNTLGETDDRTIYFRMVNK